MIDTSPIESHEPSEIFQDTYEMTSYPFQLNQLAADDSFDMLVLITSQSNGISKLEKLLIFFKFEFRKIRNQFEPV